MPKANFYCRAKDQKERSKKKEIVQKFGAKTRKKVGMGIAKKRFIDFDSFVGDG